MKTNIGKTQKEKVERNNMGSMAYSILLFYVCLNVSLYLVAKTQVLPYYVEPYESPVNMLIVRVAESLAFLTVSGIVATLVGKWLFGAASLVIWAITLIVPIFKWVFFGFPEFLMQLALTTGNPQLVLAVTTSVYALMAVVWFWFLIGIIVQRPMET